MKFPINDRISYGVKNAVFWPLCLYKDTPAMPKTFDLLLHTPVVCERVRAPHAAKSHSNLDRHPHPLTHPLPLCTPSPRNHIQKPRRHEDLPCASLPKYRSQIAVFIFKCFQTPLQRLDRFRVGRPCDPNPSKPLSKIFRSISDYFKIVQMPKLTFCSFLPCL